MTNDSSARPGPKNRKMSSDQDFAASRTESNVLQLANSGARSQTDAALDLIRSRIIDMTLEPGSRIDERLLIDRFRLGRTPAREAINRLVAEGFVRIVPNRGGTYVRKLDFNEMGEVMVAHELAEHILGQMCRIDDPTLVPDLKAIHRKYVYCVANRKFLDITKLNQQFHLRIHETVGNALFYDFATSTHRHVRRFNVYIYKAESENPENQSTHFANDLDQHNQIIESIERNDRVALSEVLVANARYGQFRLTRLIEQKTVSHLDIDLSGVRSSVRG